MLQSKLAYALHLEPEYNPAHCQPVEEPAGNHEDPVQPKINECTLLEKQGATVTVELGILELRPILWQLHT